MISFRSDQFLQASTKIGHYLLTVLPMQRDDCMPVVHVDAMHKSHQVGLQSSERVSDTSFSQPCADRHELALLQVRYTNESMIACMIVMSGEGQEKDDTKDS